MTPLKALIFDVDGTLMDSDPVHMQAFATILEPYGFTVDHAFYRRQIVGKTNARIFGDLFPDRSAEELERMADEKEALYRRMATSLVPLEGLPELLDWANARGLPLAIVTNGPRLNLAHAVESLHLEGRFPVMIAREDVAEGKPHPMPYLTALEKLGISAADAVAFEDSPSGVMAASRAGIHTFGVLTGVSAEDLREAGAHDTIAHFADPVLWRHLEARVPAATRRAAS